MAYPCNDWEQIMQTELDGTFYTELPAFRWPNQAPREDGQGRQARRKKRALARRAGNGAVATEDDEL